MRKKPITINYMKPTIEISEYYYDISSDNPASQILEVAHTDWRDFALEMADAVEEALQDQI